MAITSYPIDPARVGLVVTQGDASPYNDQSARQRFTDDHTPMWQVPALLADLDVELRIRFAAPSCPDWGHNSPLRLDGAARVSSYAGRVAGSQRASLTMRAERCEVAGQVDDDLFGGGDTGLYLVDTGGLTVVAATRLEARYPRTGDWTRFSVVRGWSSSDEALSGMEKWSVDVAGRSFSGIKRMQVVDFDQLRVSAYVNADRTTARLDLEASAIRPLDRAVVSAQPAINGRQRRDPVAAAVSGEGPSDADGGSSS